MVTRRRSIVTRGTRPRRQLRWKTDNINFSVASGSTVLVNLSLGGIELDVTLVRTIFCLRMMAVADGISANQMLISLGVGVTGAEAFIAGASAVASPAVAGEDPTMGWLFKCMYWLSEADSSSFGMVELDKDIRTARKIGQGVPFLRFENQPGAGAVFTTRLVGLVRTLYMLP